MDSAFFPIQEMLRRVQSSKEDSDIAYFFDLILLGELITKLTACFLVANLNDDVDRTKYRLEYDLVHADGLGDYSKTITSICTGNSSNLLPKEVQSTELKDLTIKSSKCLWVSESLQDLVTSIKSLGIDCDNVTAKSNLLVWFSTFAFLRNKTKGHGATTSKKCGNACEPLANSINLLISNFSVFKSPWAYLKQNISGSYRVSPISGDCSGFDFLKKKTNEEHLEDGVYCFTDRPRLISLVYSNSELRPFSLPCGGFRNTEYEVLDYVNDDRNSIDGSKFLLPPTKLKESITAGRTQLGAIGNSFENLPKDIDGYISRPKLENELRGVLINQDRFPVITLKGRGGIGKTSLALHVIHQIAQTDRFDLLLWFSARDLDLSSDGPQQVRATVANKEDIALEFFNLISSTKNGLTKTEAIEQFTSELGKTTYGKTLFVFDNFETLTNPAEIYEWLNNSIQVPNKVLITSRLNRNFKADYPIEVGGMEDDECRKLILSTARRWQVEPLLNEKYISSLISESEGHPYIIKIVLGEIAKSRKTGEVKRIVAEKDKILEALFRRTFSTLSSAGRRVFLTLCSWSSAVPMLALESILLREENERMDIDKAVEELNKSSFVELIQQDDDIFLTVPLAAQMYGQKELEVSPDKLLILKDKRLLMEFGADAKRGLQGLGPHIERKFQAVASRISSQKELVQEIPILENLAGKYPPAWLRIADLYQEYRDIENEKSACREYIKSETTNKGKINGWWRLILLCRATDDWEGESAALFSLVQISDVPFELISQAARRINEYYYEHQQKQAIHKDLKISFVEQLSSIMEKRIDEANADDLSRLAWLFLNLNNEDKALFYAKKGLEMDSYNTHCRNLYARLEWKDR